MSLHPILALDHVVHEYREYLRTEFRAKDPALRASLEEALDRPLFLAQESYYQAHRPSETAKSGVSFLSILNSQGSWRTALQSTDPRIRNSPFSINPRLSKSCCRPKHGRSLLPQEPARERPKPSSCLSSRTQSRTQSASKSQV